MIRVTFDPHTHTVFSHGSGTVEDNVRAAMQAGLKKIAISDHGFGHMFYCIKDVDVYLAEIRRVRDIYSGSIEVLAGAEFNLTSLDGHIDMPAGYENAFDIVLFGYHKLVRYENARSVSHFMLPKRHTEKLAQRNTQAYIAAMDLNKIDIITHLGYGIPIDKLAVAEHAKKRGVALEINAKHPEFSIDELKSCAKTGVMFSIGSDAHRPEDVGRFDPAIERAQAAGISAAQIINAEEE